MKKFALLLALPLLFISSAARAQIQTSGPEQWPGKIMLGVRPLGLQLNFTGDGFGYGCAGVGCTYGVGDRVTYKLGLDVAGIIASPGKLTVWLGGEVNIGGRGHLATIEPGIFVHLTLEKLLKIPLVPIITMGISGPIYVPYGFDGSVVFGAFNIKVGGGAYYFLTKNIGLGADMHFAFGPGFVKVGSVLDTGFSGYWDFLAGARFAL